MIHLENLWRIQSRKICLENLWRPLMTLLVLTGYEWETLLQRMRKRAFCKIYAIYGISLNVKIHRAELTKADLTQGRVQLEAELTSDRLTWLQAELTGYQPCPLLVPLCVSLTRNGTLHTTWRYSDRIAVMMLNVNDHVLFLFLFNLILYVPSTIFQLNRDGSSWVEPVLS